MDDKGGVIHQMTSEDVPMPQADQPASSSADTPSPASFLAAAAAHRA